MWEKGDMVPLAVSSLELRLEESVMIQSLIKDLISH